MTQLPGARCEKRSTASLLCAVACLAVTQCGFQQPWSTFVSPSGEHIAWLWRRADAPCQIRFVVGEVLSYSKYKEQSVGETSLKTPCSVPDIAEVVWREGSESVGITLFYCDSDSQGTYGYSYSGRSLTALNPEPWKPVLDSAINSRYGPSGEQINASTAALVCTKTIKNRFELLRTIGPIKSLQMENATSPSQD